MSSINGIGTTLYGKKDIHTDGSYVATEFFIIFLIPICPLASYRVWQEDTKANLFPLPGSTTKYRMEPVPLCWEQVRKVYLKFFITTFIIVGGVIGFIYLCQYLAGEPLNIFD